MKKFKLALHELLKITLYYVFIPVLFFLYRSRKIDDKLVLFADAHSDQIPFSMCLLYSKIASMNYTVLSHCQDYRNLNVIEKIGAINQFLKAYSCAKYLFLQDTYLPVAACKKKPETVVVQLWHSCGLLKKIGVHAGESRASYNYRNYDLVTTSSSECVQVFCEAMNLEDGIVQATGISRTDNYFCSSFIKQCKDEFYRLNPDALGKKVLVWAPTFRGNAANPTIDFIDNIVSLFSELSDDYYPIIKLHPHLKRQTEFDCEIIIEKLLPLVDVLIADYSAILYDYLLQSQEKQLILFAPDLQEYKSNRGLYIDYESIPGMHVTNVQEIGHALNNPKTLYGKEYEEFKEMHTGACEGGSTQRILEMINIT